MSTVSTVAVYVCSLVSCICICVVLPLPLPLLLLLCSGRRLGQSLLHTCVALDLGSNTTRQSGHCLKFAVMLPPPPWRKSLFVGGFKVGRGTAGTIAVSVLASSPVRRVFVWTEPIGVPTFGFGVGDHEQAVIGRRLGSGLALSVGAST